MSELKIDEIEGDEDSLPKEVCRVISVAPSTSTKEEYTEEISSESCMMVLPMDYSSEEDLYFPEGDESDPSIASRMGHVNLGGDSESTNESLDATMTDYEENIQLNDSESEEIAQVQLRSGKILPPPPKKGISNKDKEKEIVINDDIIPKDPKEKNTSSKGINYNILSHLRKIPAQLSIYDALVMSKDLRETLIQALKDPERYEAYFAERSLTEVLQARNEPFITFSEEDMMLGTADHNRPLYVTAESDKLIISRILIDPGSSINLISFKALRSLCLDVEYLGPDKLMVHCFNEKGQKTLGLFMLPLVFGELYTEAKFHVIDADTLFKALLGRP
ncbi:hypothetical protein MA16_Dca028377 [Dendrobium catenatum]|uniref:Aspartic peptidase DDI1-type domain-containing protein n=1 Tax=Dendrobium catenatum TaxID=906689 RepID=A0A2I0V9G8_9ASPA|nr:hypothetical protein MA16_Dca028377 [Dendrobium catenatum]